MMPEAISPRVNQDTVRRTLARLRETQFVRTHNLVVLTGGDSRPCGVCNKVITANEQFIAAEDAPHHLSCSLCHVCGQWFGRVASMYDWDGIFRDANGVPMHISCAVCEGCGEAPNAEEIWPARFGRDRGFRGHKSCGYCAFCGEGLRYWHDEILILDDGVRRIHAVCLTCADCGKPNGERATMMDNGEESMCAACTWKAHGGKPWWWDL